MAKRMISLFLSIVLVASMLPAQAFAVETGEETAPEVTVPETSAAAETEFAQVTEETTLPPAAETVPEMQAPAETTVPTAETAPQGTTAPTETETRPEETVAEAVTEEAAGYLLDGGICGDNLDWELNSYGDLKIVGSGPMYDYENYEDAPWSSYGYRIETLSLPSGLTTIGKNAFWFCAISNVTLPASLERIHDWAFAQTDLKKLTIPESVTYISKTAFEGCSYLREVRFPGSYADWLRVTDGGNEWLEMGCVHFGKQSSDAELASGTCDSNLFWSLDSSYKLTLSLIDPKYSGDMYERTFNYEVPWYDYATSITEVSLPEGLYNIGDCAFINLKKLTEITIPDSVCVIGTGAFKNCSELTKIVLPDKVSRIGNSAFYECKKLTEVSFPENLKTIGDNAFRYCSVLKKAIIPDTVTYIGEYAFANCLAMDYVSLPEGITTVSNYAFYNCKVLTSVEIPEKVTTIGNYAFQYCENLVNVGMPEGLTSIGSFAFSNCTRLRSIVIPGGVTQIGGGAFNGCTALTDVYYPGTEEQWNAITIGSSNAPLLNANIHFNGEGMEPVELTQLRYYKVWDADANRVFFEGSSLGCKVTEETDEAFRADPEALLGSYVMATVIAQWGMETLISMAPVEVKIGYATEVDGGWIVIDGIKYAIPESTEDPESLEGKYVKYFLFEGRIVALERLTVAEYVDNNAITINGSGRAYAHYMAVPAQSVKFRVNGTEGTAKTDGRGVFTVDLGAFKTVGKHRVTVEILQLGDITYDPALEMDATVTVKELSFTEKWKLSMSAMAGVAANAGLPSSTIDATLGKVGIKAGGGAAISVSQTHSGDKKSLEITSDYNGKVETEFKLGPTVKLAETKFSMPSVSAGLSGTVTSSYSVKFEDYSQDDYSQQKALATTLFGEMLRVKSNSVIYRHLYEKLREWGYEDCGAVFTYGSGAGISGKAGGTLGAASVNGKAVFGAGGVSLSATATFDRKRNTLGEKERRASYQVDGSLDALSVTLKGGDDSLKAGSAIKADILGVDTTVTAKNGLDGDSLKATYLSAEAGGIGTFFIGKNYTAVYESITFRDEILKYLTDRLPSYRSYVNGTSDILGIGDIAELAELVSNNPLLIPYSEKTKQQVLYSLPLSIGLGVGIEADLGLTFSYLESTEYDSAIGYVVGDDTVLTSRSDDHRQTVKAAQTGLVDLVQNAMASIWEKAAEFFETVYGIARDGLRTVWCWITGNPDSKYDRTVSVTSAQGGGEGGGGIRAAWGISYNIDTLSGGERTTLADGITGGASADYAMSRAATIGRPFVIGMQDNKTGARVTDFSDEPLEFTIRYAEEDLEAAGLSARSAVVLDGGIAMYRYSDDGNYFEYVGGVNDLTAMTVTADITKPGQYILAVDSCAPTLSSLDMSDFRATPTITASIDDLSGLDVSKFVFKLDGAVKVDGKNIAQHFNAEAGLFTYTVTKALSVGQHTLAFTLADTTGNTETYEYSFFVDLTAPTVSDVTVEGHTNESAVVEIRARVSDENLTAVYAMFSKKLADGTWSDEVGVQMGDMGDGLWGVDYEGDGSTIRVRICAVDIAGNQTYSAAFEAKPYAESIEISQDYLALRVGQNKTLTAEVRPAEMAASVRWSVENQAVATVDDSGKVTAKSAGTTYVIATVTDGENELTARCRIDVAQSIKLDGVKLGTNKLTTELYSTDYTRLDILLMLPQNYAASSDSAAKPEKLSAAISEAYFTDEAVRELFSLNILDDRTVEIVPTTAAINSEKIAKSFSSTITVVVEGTSYETDALTLAVKTSRPKLKVTVPAFNSFYSGQGQAIRITGGTVTQIKAEALPEWLNLSDNRLYLTEKAPRKNASGKVNLEIWTEEWAVPAYVTVSVKNTYKAPGLKLSATSVQLSNQPGSSVGVSLQLLPKNKKDSLESLNVRNISAPEGYAVEGYADGTFTLKPEPGFIPGKINLEVSFFGTEETVKLPITVKTAQVKLKLAQTGINLNAEIGDSALIGITVTPADYVLSAPTFRLVDGAGNDKLTSGELEVRFEDGDVRINTTAKTPIGAGYTLFIQSGGSREVALKIKTLGGAASVSLKQRSNLDLSFDDPAVITAAYKNYAGGKIQKFACTVTETGSGKNATKFFRVEEKNGAFYLTCNDATLVSEKGAYVLTMKLTLADGSEHEASLKLKIKRTAIKLKLSSGKLTLNKSINDVASVTVSCATKGYEFTKPTWHLMDKSGKQPAEGKLGIAWKDGKLQISTNSKTEYGATYKLLISAEAGAVPTALTVTIPAEAKSNVTATLKVKGNLDVIRSSAVLVIPGYKNCSAATPKTEQLRIVRSDNQVVTDQFDIKRNDDGTYLVSVAAGAKIDLTKKHQVQLVTTFGSTAIQAKPGNLSIKMGSAKVTAQVEGTLFAKDKNSRVTLTFSSADTTLNDVARIEIKDAKYADIFEIFDYGNGQFAIGFKNGKTIQSAKPINLVLNIFIEGNTGTKPNATGKLKLSIAP